MISIITPVYNAADYLEQCIQSVLQQNFQDWQWIIVDDGSSDASLDILQKYARSDSRIEVFRQKNQGPAAARNTALDHVKGDYLTFLDGDDWLLPDALTKINKAFSSCDPDMVMWNFTRFDGKEFRVGRYSMPKPGYHGQEETAVYAADFIFLKNNTYGQYFPSCWIRAFKTSLIKEQGLCFDPALKRTEDYMFLCKAHAAIHSMYVYEDAFIVYRANNTSITHSYTPGYLEMIDEIYKQLSQITFPADENELSLRLDLMYIYRVFTAIEQEFYQKASLLSMLNHIRKITNRPETRRSLQNIGGHGTKIFGRKILLLKYRLTVLLFLYYKRRS